MRPAVTARTFEGNLQGETIEFTMDQDSLVHLMNQYIDLYSDPKMAVLREYSTNARDAQIAAGVDEPIEITLPSPFAQTLTIKDHGTGLSLDEIRNVLSKYGASTKRESDDFNGVLGLGSKSGLAYADQFTMQSVKDGIRTTLSVSRDNRGAASMIVVEKDQPTDERNGTTVTIPTKREDTFDDEARRLFQYWPVGSVLVNGKAPKRFESQEVVPDKLYIHKTDRYKEQSVVVMGGVPYPVNDMWLFGVSDLRYDHVITAFVPMGAVEFSPSRESLRLTNHTKATLRAIGQELQESMKTAAQANVDAAPDPVEAIKRAVEWSETLPNSCTPKVWTYSGQEIPATFSLPQITVEDTYNGGTKQYAPRFTVVPRNKRNLSHSDREREIARGTLVDAVIFTGFSVNWTANYRKRLDIWQENQGETAHQPRHYLLLEGDVPAEWLHWMPEGRVHDIQEVRSIKLPTAARGAGYGNRLLGSYDAFTPESKHHHEVQAEDIDDTQPIYYFVGNQDHSRWGTTREDQARPFMQVMRHFEPSCTVVMLPHSRLKKFQGQFPAAERIQNAVHAKFEEWDDTIGPRTRKALAYHSSGMLEELRIFKGQDVKDPEILEAVKYAEHDVNGVAEKRSLFEMARKQMDLPKVKNPLDKYPLVPRGSYYSAREVRQNLQHVILYVNAAYEAAKN